MKARTIGDSPEEPSADGPDESSLDALDLRLLALLQEDARRTNKQLAADLGIAQSTCLERVRLLQAKGALRGWHAEVDPRALGRTIHALVHVRLQPKTTESVREFQQHLLGLPETVTVFVVSGADDFVVELAVREVSGLSNFVLEHITSRNDVADTRTSLIYECSKKRVLEPLQRSPS